jgi:hypothetical protein
VSETWTLNNNDLNFGVHVVNFTGTVIVPQHGPLNPTGNSIFKYLGCYLDSANGGPRLFADSTDNGANNENGLCQTTASAANAVFAGTEYHTQCWWGNAIPNITYYYPESADHCSWACPADGSQPCGGDGGYISVFYDSTKYNPVTGVCTGCSTSVTPVGGGAGGAVTELIEKSVGPYNYIGCYTEATTGRALSNGIFAYDTMTPDTCAANCTGYNYFGIEYGRECYCGNALAAGSVLSPNGDSDCNVPCGGNSTELCGAGGRLTLYKLNGTVTPVPSSSATGPITTPTSTSGPANKATVGPYSYYGCQTEATVGRTLSGATYAYNTMTLESCAANCAGFSMFGVEYGRECYCGNSFTGGSVPAPRTDCSFPCPGDGTELCGAGNRLSVYLLNSTASSSAPSGTTATSTSTSASVSTSISTSTSTSPSTPVSTGPTIKQVVGSYSYYQCQTEATNSRALSALTYASDGMTVEICISTCAGYTYAGVEYGRECYCGNSFNAGSVVAPGRNADCNMVCPGNNMEFCGAGNRLSVYKLRGALVSSSSLTTASTSLTTASTPSTPLTSSASLSASFPPLTSSSLSPTPTPTPSGPSHVKTVGSYIWIGCHTEATNSRALKSGTLINYNTMTVEMCASFCGPTYSMFGVEYGGECYCSNALQAGSVLAPTTDCSMTCGGNSQEYCGAGNRLDVYQQGSTSATSSVDSVTVASSTTSTTSTVISAPSSTSTSISASKSTASTFSTSTTSTQAAAYTGPPVISQGNINFTYYGCLGEPSVGRALPNIIESNSVAMTIERCLGECWQYQFAGVEYGQESVAPYPPTNLNISLLTCMHRCWCANAITTGTSFNQQGCNMPCKGNSSEICGGSIRLSVYQHK